MGVSIKGACPPKGRDQQRGLTRVREMLEMLLRERVRDVSERDVRERDVRERAVRERDVKERERC